MLDKIVRCRRRVKGPNCVVLPLFFIIIYVSETTTITDLSEELAIKSELQDINSEFLHKRATVRTKARIVWLEIINFLFRSYL